MSAPESSNRSRAAPTAGASSGDEGFEAAWRSRFQEFAEAKDDDAGIAGWSPTGLDARVRRFAGVWQPPARGGRWLDAGCGAGTYSRMLSLRGLEVLGADYSLPTLLKAKVRGTEPIAFAVADVRHLPFRDASFDGALCFGVMQALSRSDEAVGALAAVVKPGGEVWIDALNAWCVPNLLTVLRRRIRGQPRHLRYESPKALKQIMREQGLERVALYWLPILPAKLQRFQGWVETPVARWLLRYVPFAGLLASHSFILSGERPSTRRAG
jgi:ubiquinone/menaquinone biosynthesis C-methylase UbiE